MSRKQNWYIGRYVRAVSGFLPCSGKVKKPLLDALRAQAEEYIEGGGDSTAPSCSYAALSLPLIFFRLRMKGISRFPNRRSFAVTP